MNPPPRTIRRDTRVFISAVTRELGTVRKLVEKALKTNDYHAIEQEYFTLDYRDLVDKIRERIESTDAVIHIAGHSFGAEPRNQPSDAPRRSYTQLEYEIAVELGKPVYVFLTADGFPADPHEPEPLELRELQEAHRQRLTSTGRDYKRTASAEELDREVRGIRLKLEQLLKELQGIDVTVAATGRRQGRWLLLLAVVGLVSLGTLGIVERRQQIERQAQLQEALREDEERRKAEVERQKAETERLKAEAARLEARKVDQIEREFAGRFLHQLLTNKEITAEDARQRAMKDLPALVHLQMAEIITLIDREIDPGATEAPLPPLERARAALAQGDRGAVFQLADAEHQEGIEMAMLDGTAALAQYRETPEPSWNERALAAFRRAMALSNPNLPAECEAWTKAAESAASVLKELAHYGEAEPLLRECLRLEEDRNGPSSPAVATVLRDLADLLRETNRPVQAEPLHRRALAIDQQSVGFEDLNVANDLTELAILLEDTSRPGEAEPLHRRALAIDEQSLGPDHMSVAYDLRRLADWLRATGRPIEAEPLYRRALTINERSLGPEQPEVSVDLNNLAVLLQGTNRSDEAEPLFRRALAIDGRSLGPDHPEFATVLSNLGMLLRDTGRPVQAEPLLRRALEIRERSLGPEHPVVAAVLWHLASLLEVTNRKGEAEPLLVRAVSIFSRSERATGREHRTSQFVIRAYRQILASRKLAEPEIEAKITAAREGTGKLTPIEPEVTRLLGQARPVADALAALDRRYKEEGKPPSFFLDPKELIVPHLDAMLRLSLDGWNLQGVTAFRRGEFAEAIFCYDAALRPTGDGPAAESARHRIRLNRAAALREIGRVEEARDELSTLLPEIEKGPAGEFLAQGRARYHLALCRWRLGEPDEARKLAEASLAAYDEAPKDKPIDASMRGESAGLIEALKGGKAPPPLAVVDAPAAIERARDRHAAIEELAALGQGEATAPLLERILGPVRPTREVLDGLDRKNRERGRPEVWFLPLDQPISPHLDELLGKPPE